MAAINFPSSPAENDTFTHEGRSYLFTGGAWISQTAAVSPGEGDVMSPGVPVTSGNFASFDGTTGTAIEDSGFNSGSFVVPADLGDSAGLDVGTGAGTVAGSSIVTVWLVKNAISLTPIDTATLAPASNTTASVTLDYPSGGFAVFGWCLDVTGSAVSWSSATEQIDQALSSRRHSHAFKHPTTATTNHMETVSSWSLNVSCMAGISFR